MVNLMNGDCLEEMKKIESGTVDLVLADPPYGTTACKWDSVIDLRLMWEQLTRLIKPQGVIVLMSQTPFDKVLGASNLPMLKYEWIWEKPAATGFFNAKKAPLKSHENALVFSDDSEDHWNMLVFYKKLPTYQPQITHGHERKTSGRDDVKSDIYGKAVKKTHYDSTSRYPRSVQVFSSDKQTESYHPTQKPVELMEYFTRTYSQEGDLVLDFAMGSGTTGVAAKKLGRNFIGIELDENFFNAAQKRIHNTQEYLL